MPTAHCTVSTMQITPIEDALPNVSTFLLPPFPSLNIKRLPEPCHNTYHSAPISLFKETLDAVECHPEPFLNLFIPSLLRLLLFLVIFPSTCPSYYALRLSVLYLVNWIVSVISVIFSAVTCCEIIIFYPSCFPVMLHIAYRVLFPILKKDPRSHWRILLFIKFQK